MELCQTVASFQLCNLQHSIVSLIYKTLDCTLVNTFSLFPFSKLIQAQQMRLNASNLLITSIQLNEMMRDAEAEAGQVANSSEDAEIEDDDG